MTSDPKHLPPRDCLVLMEGDSRGAKPYLVHALFQNDAWFSAETGKYIRPSRVITWRELPEVE